MVVRGSWRTRRVEATGLLRQGRWSRAVAAGTAKLVGTFKLCVCSDETCEIGTPRIELAVPVS